MWLSLTELTEKVDSVLRVTSVLKVKHKEYYTNCLLLGFVHFDMSCRHVFPKFTMQIFVLSYCFCVEGGYIYALEKLME